MTQFIIVRAVSSPVSVPGIAVRSLNAQFPLSVARRTLCGDGQLYEVVSDRSGDADSLVDDLFNALNASGATVKSPLLDLLHEQVTKGGMFACWYRADFEDLPVAHTWFEAEKLILECATRQPPEIYMRFDRAS